MLCIRSSSDSSIAGANRTYCGSNRSSISVDSKKCVTIFTSLYNVATIAIAKIMIIINMPESIQENKNLATLGLIAGFVLMMVLDVALG